MNISKMIKCLRGQKVFMLLLAGVFLLGVILGLILSTSLEKLFITKNVVRYYMNALAYGGDLSGLFFGSVFADVVALLLFFGISFVPFGAVLYFVLIFYRGYVSALAASVFMSQLGVGGFMLYFFAVFLGSLVVTAALAAYAALSRCIGRCKSDVKKRKLENLAFCFLIALCGAILRLLVILLILRPLNFSF